MEATAASSVETATAAMEAAVSSEFSRFRKTFEPVRVIKAVRIIDHFLIDELILESDYLGFTLIVRGTGTLIELFRPNLNGIRNSGSNSCVSFWPISAGDPQKAQKDADVFLSVTTLAPQELHRYSTTFSSFTELL